jgi:hypothetical protein
MTWSPWRLLLALASCAFLAWNLQRTLTGVAVGTPAEYTYTFTAPQGAPHNTAAASGEIWLRLVYTDGRDRPLRSLERSGAWEDAGFALVHRGDTQPAAVTARGKFVTACFLSTRTAGIVHVDGAPGLTEDVDLFRDQDASSLTCLDLAGGRLASPVSDRRRDVALRTLLAFVPLLVVAALWRPWTSAGRLEGWIVVHVSVLHLLVWLTQAIGYNSDAIGYAQGFGPLSHPTSFPPGYILVVAAWGAIATGVTGLALAGAQHVCMVLTVFGLQRMTRAIVPPDLASLGFLVTGSVAPTMFLPQTIMSENVALFGMAGALWIASRRGEASAATGAWRRDLGTAACVAIATVTRVVPLAALPIPLALVYAVEHGFTTRTLVRTARVLLCAAAVPLLLATGYWQRTGSFALTTSTGFHAYNRVVTEQVLIDRDGEATRRFLAIVGDRPLRGVPHWEIRQELHKRGFTYVDEERLLRDVAREGLWTAPMAFAVHSVLMTGREYAANPMGHIPPSGDLTPIPMFEDEPLLGLRSSTRFWRDDLDKMFDVVWRILLWAPLLGIVLLPLLPGPARLTFLALLSVPVGYLFFGSLVEFFLDRYVVAVMPFILVLTPTPLAALMTRWRPGV